MRALSLIIAAAYMLLTLLAAPSVTAALGSVLLVTAFLLLPLACIWYADEIGGYVGMLPGPNISRRTPGAFVKVGGWVLLMLPALVFVYWRTQA